MIPSWVEHSAMAFAVLAGTTEDDFGCQGVAR